MQAASSKIALKPYLEAVRTHCEGLSREELVETILDLAQEASVGGRVAFLDKIGAGASRAASTAKATETNIEEIIFERIATLKEEIEERISSIENGAYWDELADREEQDYDEEPDRITEEQLDELEQLFLETDGFFLSGQLEAARRLYQGLFALHDSDEEISGSITRKSLDLREARARYCRCVYETTEPARRVEELLQCMDTDAPMHRYCLDLNSEPRPLLQDIIDARPGDLPDWESFLPVWKERLAARRTTRAAILQMEAVQRIEGVDGLACLARQWKSDQPCGYLFWIQCLEEKRDWQGMLEAGLEALEVLPNSGFREQAAGRLVKAAAELGNANLVLRGKREQFLSAPNEANLIELLEEAECQDVRLHELEAILSSREQIEGGERGRGELRLKMLLMAGDLDEAFNLGKNEASLGWSYGKAGALFSAILSVLSETSQKAATINTLLKEYAARSHSFYRSNEEKAEKVYAEIMKGLALVSPTREERQKYAAWADGIGRSRIEQIVSNKHRGAYDRAACVLGALAEYYVLSNRKDKALSLLNEFLKVKFPRHHAFRSEVKGVIGGSPLLKELRAV